MFQPSPLCPLPPFYIYINNLLTFNKTPIASSSPKPQINPSKNQKSSLTPFLYLFLLIVLNIPTTTTTTATAAVILLRQNLKPEIPYAQHCNDVVPEPPPPLHPSPTSPPPPPPLPTPSASNSAISPTATKFSTKPRKFSPSNPFLPNRLPYMAFTRSKHLFSLETYSGTLFGRSGLCFMDQEGSVNYPIQRFGLVGIGQNLLENCV